MPVYNVHIYREMRLLFSGIESPSPHAAAHAARAMPTSEAQSIEDCEGGTLSALVDLVGDDEYANSTMVDFREALIPIPNTPFTIDGLNSDEEYLYIELKQGVTVVLKATEEGLVIDAFPQHTQGGDVSEPVVSTWAVWSDFL